MSWIPEESSDEVVDRVDTVMMSTYDLARSPDHSFFYGDIVVRLRPTASAAEETVSVQRSNKMATNDLSWVGHTVDLCDAQFIQVKWGDGNTSKVHQNLSCAVIRKHPRV